MLKIIKWMLGFFNYWFLSKCVIIFGFVYMNKEFLMFNMGFNLNLLIY